MLPVFLVSQLENQKLTEEGSPFVLVTTLVAFRTPNSVPLDIRRQPSLVLAFRSPQHQHAGSQVHDRRAYGHPGRPGAGACSHVGSGQQSRAWYVDLGYTCLEPLAKVCTADVVRESGSESSSGYKPTTGKNRDDSSTASDELLFKGNISRRALRDATRGSARGSGHEFNLFPMREPLRQTVPQPALPVQSARENARTATPLGAPMAPPMVAPMTAPNSASTVARETAHDQQRPTEWRIHGRSDSDANIPEPIPAPAGDIAQRSEGFKRFYKAVVSPTHVRVTAGGRIVPNTRGPPSPTNKRATDHAASIENMGLSDKNAQGKLPTNQLPMGQPIPIVPQFLPGYPPGFQPMQPPMSFVPMAFSSHMPQGFQFAQPPVTPAAMAPAASGSASTSKDNADHKAFDSQSASHLPGDKQDKPKISPPEWFDYTKPYFYNGQIIYPVGNMSTSLANPMGGPMMPMQMVSVPQGAPSQLQAPMMHPALPHGGSQMMAGSSFSPPSHGPHQIHGGAHPIIPANLNFAAPNMAPPPSSIRRSEITRKQIAGFKHALKYHEDQLQYNRHQIDEREMEMKAQQYRDHIAHFEAVLKQQLEAEAETLDHKKPEVGRNDLAQQRAEGSVSGDTGVQQSQHESEDAVRRRAASGRQGININIGDGGNAVFQRPIAANRSYGEPSRQTGIPSEAVLAPAFEPGGRTLHEIANESNERLKSEGVWKYGHGIQNIPSRGVSRPFNPSLSHQSDRAEGSSSSASVSGQGGSAEAFGTSRSAKGKGVDRGGGSSGYSRSSFGVPYLLGTLPKGFDPRKATDHDYIYTRPLNEDEVRARYLYWGKAPKSAMRGLPKYDGKHFYPPSPVQEPSSPVTAHRNPTARSDAEHAYRQTKSDQDPFRPMTPVHDSISKPVGASEDGYAMGRLTRNVSFETQVDSSGLEDVPVGDSIDVPETGTILRNRENSADAGSIGSTDRRSERSGYGPVPGPSSYGSLPDPYAHFFSSPQYRVYGHTDTMMQRETLADRFEEGSDDQRGFIDYGTGSSASSLFGSRSGFPKPFDY
ncbi:uncharacterized protein PODANS_6_4570 [Podospora anserina S mat+]|uniref:Podospora anserina S mat+ genomic DNA chromosome 6, supercontig 2 n=1 Tax=Podospora anserina (strain S / ATCC MYA-4624 / DSM 980 / FGSC 10383) TaxID=515849 RepID=B2B1V4_PODAN|nr:uncharacterized protein PODANS_6_4570 [Podospora anserina S mat+]CAP71089.1 unnamed protein product [Podospora anserina S mat+]CDP30488.1 Putative protein of unknown function [Podospora anserina S mat+]